MIDESRRICRRPSCARRIAASEVTRRGGGRSAASRGSKQLNPTLNAVVTLNPARWTTPRELDRAAREGRRSGPLRGLTVGIKDVTPVAGLRTTFGSPIYADYVPKEDALIVRRLREAGAIILGKTNSPEFAAGGNTLNDVFGRTRNPWDPRRAPADRPAAARRHSRPACSRSPKEPTSADRSGFPRRSAAWSVCARRSAWCRRIPPIGLGHAAGQRPMARTAEDVALMLQAIAGPSRALALRAAAEGRGFRGAVAGSAQEPAGGLLPGHRRHRRRSRRRARVPRAAFALPAGA